MKINPKLKVLGQLRILPLFVAMLVMAVSNETDVSAQTQSEVQISGVVLDEYGETFPGAGVVIEGTQNGTVTGMDGRFVIRAVPGSSLVISFLGYNDSIVQVPDKDTDMRIVLTEARQSLDEVVVVAFGTQKKETVTETPSREEYMQKKFVSKEERKVRNRIAFLEKGIEELEGKMKDIEKVLAQPGPSDDIMELTRQYLELKRDLDAKTDEWGKLVESIG